MRKQLLPPLHPGEILWEEFLKPLGIAPSYLAQEIGVSAQLISEIVVGNRAITERVITRTSAPRFNNSWTVWLPTVPVPPMTTIFDIGDLLGLCELPEYQR